MNLDDCGINSHRVPQQQVILPDVGPLEASHAICALTSGKVTAVDRLRPDFARNDSGEDTAMKPHIGTTMTVATALMLSIAVRANCSEIHDAALAGDLEKVRALLKKNPKSVHEQNEDGETPLHLAWSSTQVIKLLLENGADVNARDKDGRTPLMDMAMFNAVDAAELLVQNKADLKAKDHDGNTVLHFAARTGRREIAELLIAHGADVNARNSLTGWTPLHDAAHGDKPELVELLLKNKAEIDAKDQTGQTPLHEAAYSGSLAAVKVLVTNGAVVNARDDSGMTPLGRALEGDQQEVANYLRHHGGRE